MRVIRFIIYYDSTLADNSYLLVGGLPADHPFATGYGGMMISDPPARPATPLRAPPGLRPVGPGRPGLPEKTGLMSS